MRGHRAYLDTPPIVTTRANKPPLPRWHRKWLNIAQVGTRRMAETAQHGSVRSTGDAVAKPCAQKGSRP